jgi:predicted secreted protein
MPSVPGRLTVVSWSADDSTYHTITGIDTFQDGESAAPIADNEFGDQWSQNVPGILDNKITMSGGLRLSDTNGQVAISTALKAGSYGYIKVLWDGTNGYKQQVLVTKYQAGSKTNDRVTVSIELASQGAPTSLP